jgi:AcrR family transcriptional regulator
VFNYFPTKESMFFDRDESYAEALAEAVRHRGAEPLGEVVVHTLIGGVPLDRWQDLDEAHPLRLFRRFCEVAESSPALRAAPYIELERFTATIAAALAERIGSDPDDPEVTLTAIVVGGLVRVWARATFTHVRTVSSMAALEGAVRADVSPDRARAGTFVTCRARQNTCSIYRRRVRPGRVRWPVDRSGSGLVSNPGDSARLQARDEQVGEF